MNMSHNNHHQREMAVQSTMQPQSHFLRLPAELRNIIYSHLLISPPQKTVECVRPTITTEDFFASTCRPKEQSLMTIGRKDPGSSIDASLLRVNKQCYQEGAAMLYGNTQIVMRHGVLQVPRTAMPHVVRFHLALTPGELTTDLTIFVAALVRFELPSIRVVSLHIDVDCTKDDASVDLMALLPLLEVDTERVAFVIDLHAAAIWDGDEFFMEAIRDMAGHEEATKRAEVELFKMRENLMRWLEIWASQDGKKFKVLEG